jgi:hypothetical protein
MDGLLKHFWLFFLVVMSINVALWRRRLRELEARGHASRQETGTFLRGALIAVAAISVLGELVVLVAGWPSALCVWTADIHSPGAIVAWGTSFATSALLLWWIWVGRGATTLSRLGPAIFRRQPFGDRAYRPYPPALVRGVVTLFVVASTVAVIVMPLQMPPELGCPVRGSAPSASTPP